MLDFDVALTCTLCGHEAVDDFRCVLDAGYATCGGCGARLPVIFHPAVVDAIERTIPMPAPDGSVTRFKCAHCGLLTTGRLPRGPWGAEGDGTLIYPRRHNHNGKPCPGNVLESEWIDVPAGTRVYGGMGGRHSVVSEKA